MFCSPPVPLHEDLVVSNDGVGDVTERASRRPIRKQYDVSACENVTCEIRQDAAVGDLEAGTVVVEGWRDLDRQAILCGEIDTKCLAETLRLVIAGPGPLARDIAAVGFGVGMLSGVGRRRFRCSRSRAAVDAPARSCRRRQYSSRFRKPVTLASIVSMGCFR